jgi:hypothetical protein
MLKALSPNFVLFMFAFLMPDDVTRCTIALVQSTSSSGHVDNPTCGVNRPQIAGKAATVNQSGH